jgi:hypothetical protein
MPCELEGITQHRYLALRAAQQLRQLGRDAPRVVAREQVGQRLSAVLAVAVADSTQVASLSEAVAAPAKDWVLQRETSMILEPIPTFRQIAKRSSTGSTAVAPDAYVQMVANRLTRI